MSNLARKQHVIPMVPSPALTLVKPRMCPTCKFELKAPGDHGFINGGWDTEKHRTILKPCPMCSLSHTGQVTIEQGELVTRVFGGSHIPFHAQHWTFDSYPGDSGAKWRVQAFVEHGLTGDLSAKRGLFLTGPTSVGKTGLAVSALKAVLDAGHTGLFVMTCDLMDRLRATNGTGVHESKDALLGAVTSVPWLVLDDLGVEKPTAYVMEQLYLIVEKRRSKGLFTIITSNLSTKDLEAYWRPVDIAEGAFHPGKRIVERLREYCDGITVKGANLRAAKNG